MPRTPGQSRLALSLEAGRLSIVGEAMTAALQSITESILENRWLALGLRLGLGGIFIASSISKLPHQAEFTSTVLSYQLLPGAMARPFAAALPFVEIFVGCCLVLGLFTRFVSALSIVLTVGFIVANIWALARHVGGFYCSCLGDLVNLTHTASLGIDLAMGLTASFLFVRHERVGYLGLGTVVQRLGPQLTNTAMLVLKVALIGLSMVAVIALVGEKPNLVDAEIHEALKADRVVLLFIYQGDPADSLQARTILSDIEVRYSQQVHVIRYAVGRDRRVDDEFPVQEEATLLILTRDSTGDYAIRHRFEGSFDPGVIEAAVIGSINSNVV
jgi:uncharacterized membrane protein YphA (DoxX/SURF4 family)